MELAACGLLDLGPDELQEVLSLLRAPDLCSCALTCRALRDASSKDALWTACCATHFRSSVEYQALEADCPEQLRCWLGAASVKELYKLVVTSPFGWPEGVWGELDADNPKGRLLYVVARPRRDASAPAALDFVLAPPREAAILAPPREALALLGRDLGEVDAWVSVLLRPARRARVARGAPATAGAPSALEVEYVLGEPHAFSLVSLTHVEVQQAHGPKRELRMEFESRRLWGSRPTCYMRRFRFVGLVPPPPWPTALPPPRPGAGPGCQVDLGPDCQDDAGCFDGQAALRQLEGLWATHYGGHGEEVLACALRPAEHAAAGAWPEHVAGRVHLEALKVTGDANVPAGYISFVAFAHGVTSGRYDGREEVVGGLLMIRPTYAYAEHGVPQVVNLAARRVAARFPALGQVNADPRVWRPELVPAQLLLYDGDAPRFSLLWDDAERPWRHLMDFRPVHVARRPPLQA